jgi:stress-induced morphogen
VLEFSGKITDCRSVSNVEATAIEKLIRAAIPDSDVRVVDLQATGDHFEVTVIAPAFDGVGLVQRHRMIYEALGDAMSGPIHAMTIKALTPEQHREGMVGLGADADRSN